MEPSRPAPSRADAASPDWTRRALLHAGLAVGAGLAVPRAGWADPAPAALAMPTRPFGSTGRTVSVFGLGCFYVGGLSETAAAGVVGRALDLGCTYVDTAPSYFAGVSESHVGKALGRRRDSVFLSTKTLERTAAGAQRELEASLKRLRTEVIDMVQVHCVRDAADLEAVLSAKGPLTALRAARDKGQIRFIGVTGHEEPAVMKATLAASDWASILLPMNPVDAHWKSFITGTLPEAKARGIARVAMKVFASGRLVQGPGALSPEDCLRFAFDLDLSCAIVGCSSIAEVELAARIAAEAKPLDLERRAALVAAAKPYSGRAGAGVEWYKHA